MTTPTLFPWFMETGLGIAGIAVVAQDGITLVDSSLLVTLLSNNKIVDLPGELEVGLTTSSLGITVDGSPLEVELAPNEIEVETCQ